MKKFLSGWFGSTTPTWYVNGIMLMLFGLLIVGGGRIGIQATPEGEVRWIDAFSKIDAWVGWVIVWMAFDSMLAGGRVTTFLLSKTVTPIGRAILSNILGEEKMAKFMKRFENKERDDVDERKD